MKFLKRIIRRIQIAVFILKHGRPETPQEKLMRMAKKRGLTIHTYKPEHKGKKKYSKAPSIASQKAREERRFLQEFPNLR